MRTYQRKSDNRWVAVEDYGKDELGKRIRLTVYGSTEREALKKLRKKVSAYENGDMKKKVRYTVPGYLKNYIKKNETKWALTTLELYKMYVKVHFSPYFGNDMVKNLKPSDIDDFYEYKLETLSNNTVLKFHKFLNSAFAWGVKKELIERNVCEKATPPKYIEYVPNVYNNEQFLQLWYYVQDKYDRVPICLGAGCGLRRGEIFGLKWSDINFKDGKITIDKTRTRFLTNIEKDPKTRKSKRTIQVPQYVIDTLYNYKKEQKVFDIDNWVLNVGASYYSHRFKWLLNKFDLPSTRLHDLRHFNAVIMMNAGVPDRVAADRLGHSDINTLRKIYQHTTILADKNASDKIEEIMAKKI